MIRTLLSGHLHQLLPEATSESEAISSLNAAFFCSHSLPPPPSAEPPEPYPSASPSSESLAESAPGLDQYAIRKFAEAFEVRTRDRRP